MKINWKLTILAGLAGTLVFDLVGLALTGQWWDIPTLLGNKLGTGQLAGVGAHYANGALLAVIYAAIAPSLWGSARTRALTYVTIQTVFGVWLFMMPLLGAGIAGLAVGPLMPLIALARHWGYGLVLGAIVPVPGLNSAKQSVGSSYSQRATAKEAA